MVPFLLLYCSGCDTQLSEGSGWIDSWAESDPLRPEINNEIERALDPLLLRVGTYNVHFGEDPDGIAERILEVSALASVDIWLLQEIEYQPSEGESRASKLAGLLDKNFFYAPARTEGEGTHGLAILSDASFVRPRVMLLPQADVSINKLRRIAISVDVEWNETWVSVTNFHLDTRLNPSVRIGQLDPAIRELDDVALIGGDTNDNGFHWTQNSIPNVPADRALGEDAHIFDDYMEAMGFDNATQGVGATADAIVEEFRLDSIFSRSLTPSRVGVSRIEGSDHFPVWAEFRNSKE